MSARTGQEEVATPVALASFKHFGNLRRSAVKEVYMINVRYRWGDSKGPFCHFFARVFFGQRRAKCEDSTSEFSSARRGEVRQISITGVGIDAVLSVISLNTIPNMTSKRWPCTPCSSKSVSPKPAIQSVSKLCAMGTLLFLCGLLSMGSIRKLSLLCAWQQQQHRHWHKHAMGVTRLRTLRSAGHNWPVSCKFTGLHQRFTAWLELAEH